MKISEPRPTGTKMYLIKWRKFSGMVMQTGHKRGQRYYVFLYPKISEDTLTWDECVDKVREYYIDNCGLPKRKSSVKIRQIILRPRTFNTGNSIARPENIRIYDEAVFHHEPTSFNFHKFERELE
jgi:hypothetical protein